MDKNIVLAVIFGCGRSCRSYGNGISDLSVTVMDAAARGLKHPKLWGLLACERE